MPDVDPRCLDQSCLCKHFEEKQRMGTISLDSVSCPILYREDPSYYNIDLQIISLDRVSCLILYRRDHVLLH